MQGIINLLDILRAHAEEYCIASHLFTSIRTTLDNCIANGVQIPNTLIEGLRVSLNNLAKHCEHLPMTSFSILKLLGLLSKEDTLRLWVQSPTFLADSISEVQSRLEDELRLNLFFKLPQDRKKFFVEPLHGWEEAVDRFPETISNVEEMSKCFALSRYAAAVYHACQAIEVGLIQLGIFIGVNDPKSGWTAVTKRLETIVVKTKHEDLEQKYKDCRLFLEQMHGLVEALKSAWRNKIDHAQGRLILMAVDFTPDIAEEIIIASRSFMRRLATEMPKKPT
ncbi:MAG: hypothetical protein ABSD38_20830 [Syntrophorhabdales bacterium]